jgi:hypothetical protein
MKVVLVPVLGLMLPAEQLHVKVPNGDPTKIRFTSSPTPIFVLVWLGGVIATHTFEICITLKPIGIEFV